jgi:hypothetical protein
LAASLSNAQKALEIRQGWRKILEIGVGEANDEGRRSFGPPAGRPDDFGLTPAELLRQVSLDSGYPAVKIR